MGRVFVRASQYRLEAYPGTFAVSPLPVATNQLLISASTFLTSAPFDHTFGNGFAVVYRGSTNRLTLNYSLAYYLNEVRLSVTTGTTPTMTHMSWNVPTFAANNRYTIACHVDFNYETASVLYINGDNYGPGGVSLGRWSPPDADVMKTPLSCLIGAERTLTSTFANAYGGTLQDTLVVASDQFSVGSDDYQEILSRLSLGYSPRWAIPRLLAIDSAMEYTHTRITGATPEPVTRASDARRLPWDPIPGPTAWETKNLKMLPLLGTRPWVVRPGRPARARGSV